ncbi:patatin-like phospholipase family protein [Mycobacterium sp. CBMA271]|uniref:patatin-like phospholipase family protein n=1 Tax=unclassified Mycobacteroides TaxID=2618759 RepID=UPI0012DF1A64|nr:MULTISPECIES: patatin-like phospholipase family protein [unclassified Mycobacteroides]MUM19342.1 alpha/beta hydrolase [Mycobacteroides sp. CBMA 326]MUM21755.1 patatin-like phospholipase family protein [Mycobacteroides sp. CBMA 271]
MTTAFVLSGGASLGSIQVGMLLAMAEAGVTPDLIVGTSVGALNGGWIASRPDVDGINGLADLWRSLSRNDVFPPSLATGFLGFIGRRRSLVSDAGLRRLLKNHVEFQRLEDAPIPLHVVATEVLTGEDVRLSSGDPVDAIAASAAVPAVLPPVRINGHDYMDGGVVNNTPLSHAVALGATEIWVLPTGYACALPEAPRGAVAMALHAMTLAINQRMAADVARFESTVDLRVVPPLCPVRTSPADFSHSAELIGRAHEQTRRWLTLPHFKINQADLLAHLHE